MNTIAYLGWRSVLNRRGSVLLTVLSIALSVAMLIGVERLRNDARDGFARTVSGTDLIVGARGGQVQLLLYSVFHIGNASNNLSWQSVQHIAALPQVDWVVPLSLGDTHLGYRVVGTTAEYFARFRHGDDRALVFAAGRAFAPAPEGIFETVIGAELAVRHGYQVGAKIVLSHGSGGFADHGDKPFTVVGILAPSGTPVDRSVLVSLEGIEAIHVDWQGGAPIPGVSIGAEHVRKFDLTPKTVTAAMVGLKNRVTVFRVQRQINTFADEPLTAILPGATLQELWSLVGVAERALLAVAAVVVVVGLAGLVAVMIAGLGERRRELAILRALGAGPRHVLGLLMLESVTLAVVGILCGLLLVHGLIWMSGGWLTTTYGIYLGIGWPSLSEWGLLGAVLAASVLASLVPAYRAYRYAVADGMTIRM
ncbi:ABC transporter permease [Parazoarcus communis]|uniref:ABC transporter permease n=1 Tax=Parazoarcus communis SWub3 = DSM 12120 TaxID=1121029 RepID=A0A323US34_9RHOO|nr:ABC transporter permease [Parazoarcus communis]NMG72474.1 FtsX-like permease family protein [Parazoarcus communis SWub3 = DSM 12120]PZA15344.1 ABC transporter permease [Azoarcus communis] [Parazoarcus communis SWub3 = DSM 12120]